MRRIPATIVTGFLGAGKTSLVRHLLATASGHRLAIIVNEFGELGIDRELLLGCGDAACQDDDIVELANGCLCCTVADDFLPTLTRLIDYAARRTFVFVDGHRILRERGRWPTTDAGQPTPRFRRRRGAVARQAPGSPWS